MKVDPPAAEPPSLDACLELLKGPSDERRLVGLLLVTRLLAAPLATDALPAVAAAVGPTFLARLLRGGGAQAGLAAAVAATLCRAPELAGGHAFGALLLPQLLHAAAGATTDEDSLAADACEAAALIAAALTTGAEAAALATTAAQAARRSSAATPVVLAASRLLAVAAGLPVRTSAEAAVLSDALSAVLPRLAAALRAAPAEAAAQGALAHTVAVLALPPACEPALGDASQPWAVDLGHALNALLRARPGVLPLSFRRASLAATAAAARHAPPAWLATAADGALLPPLCQVACVEATVALHALVRAPGDAVASSEEGSPSDALALTLQVFEATVEALSAAAEASPDGGGRQLRHGLTALAALAGQLLDFLEECEEGHAMSDHAFAPLAWNSPLAAAALRALGCFWAQAPGVHRARAVALLPRALRSASGGGWQAHPLVLLLPFLLQATDGEAEAADLESEEAGPADLAAAAATEALLEAGGGELLTRLACAAAEDRAADASGVLEALLGVMRNIAVRGLRAPGAQMDPDAAEARRATEGFLPALVAVTDWASRTRASELCEAVAAAGVPPAQAEGILAWLETLPV